MVIDFCIILLQYPPMKIGYAQRGKHVGRPRKPTLEQVAQAREAIDSGMETSAGMVQLLGVDYSTLWRAFRDADRNRLLAPAARLPTHVPLAKGDFHGRH